MEISGWASVLSLFCNHLRNCELKWAIQLFFFFFSSTPVFEKVRLGKVKVGFPYCIQLRCIVWKMGKKKVKFWDWKVNYSVVFTLHMKYFDFFFCKLHRKDSSTPIHVVEYAYFKNSCSCKGLLSYCTSYRGTEVTPCPADCCSQGLDCTRQGTCREFFVGQGLEKIGSRLRPQMAKKYSWKDRSSIFLVTEMYIDFPQTWFGQGAVQKGILWHLSI